MKCPSCDSTELHEDLTVVGGKRVCANCSWTEGEPVPSRTELHEKLEELANLVVRMAVVYDAALKWSCTGGSKESTAHLVNASCEALEIELALAKAEKLS